jgi:hypothetical protein
VVAPTGNWFSRHWIRWTLGVTAALIAIAVGICQLWPYMTHNKGVSQSSTKVSLDPNGNVVGYTTSATSPNGANNQTVIMSCGNSNSNVSQVGIMNIVLPSPNITYEEEVVHDKPNRPAPQPQAAPAPQARWLGPVGQTTYVVPINPRPVVVETEFYPIGPYNNGTRTTIVKNVTVCPPPVCQPQPVCPPPPPPCNTGGGNGGHPGSGHHGGH